MLFLKSNSKGSFILWASLFHYSQRLIWKILLFQFDRFGVSRRSRYNERKQTCIVTKIEFQSALVCASACVRECVCDCLYNIYHNVGVYGRGMAIRAQNNQIREKIYNESQRAWSNHKVYTGRYYSTVVRSHVLMACHNHLWLTKIYIYIRNGISVVQA
jgi:hypothetical protein